MVYRLEQCIQLFSIYWEENMFFQEIFHILSLLQLMVTNHIIYGVNGSFRPIMQIFAMG